MGRRAVGAMVQAVLVALFGNNRWSDRVTAVPDDDPPP
jgi:hypothetical protein